MSEYPNRIRELRLQQNLTAERLAEMTGLSVSYVTRLENGVRNLSVKNLERFAEALQVPKSRLLEADDDKPPKRVPLLSWVSAGHMAAADGVTERDIKEWVEVAGLPSGSWIGLRIEGDSMDRIAPPGSIILIDRHQTEPVPGKLYVFGYDDGQATFKRFRADPDRLEPMSSNPAHEIIFPRNGLRVLGRARRVITDLD